MRPFLEIGADAVDRHLLVEFGGAILRCAPAGAGADSIVTSTQACSPATIPACVDINVGSGPPGHSSSSIDQGFTTPPPAFGYGIREISHISLEMGKFGMDTSVGGFVFLSPFVGLSFRTNAIGQLTDTNVKIGGGVGAGVMVLPWHVTGLTKIDTTFTGFIPTGPLGAVAFGLRCSSFPSSGPGSFCGGNTDLAFTLEGVTPAAFDVLLEVPFTFGDTFSFTTTVAMTSSFGYSSADIPPGFIPGTGKIDGDVEADFGSTGILGPARIFDSFGRVTSPTVTSDSGFDYLKGFVEAGPGPGPDPDPGPGPGGGVPEPASAALLGAGVAAMAALRALRIRRR